MNTTHALPILLRAAADALSPGVLPGARASALAAAIDAGDGLLTDDETTYLLRELVHVLLDHHDRQQLRWLGDRLRVIALAVERR